MSVSKAFPGSVHEAETCWYDTSRWPAWVDGLAGVVSVEGDWPRAGGRVIWESGPAGRGRVIERVLDYQQLGGQQVEIEDDSISGQQTVAFTPIDGTVAIDLSLAYQIKQRSVFTPLVDRLFIRTAIASSLRTTLTRFGVELAARR